MSAIVKQVKDSFSSVFSAGRRQSAFPRIQVEKLWRTKCEKIMDIFIASTARLILDPL